MREPRNGQQGRAHYLVLSRSCKNLYEEISALFADRPDIQVVVDRRRGPGRMMEIPLRNKPRVERRKTRRMANLKLVLTGLAKEEQKG